MLEVKITIDDAELEADIAFAAGEQAVDDFVSEAANRPLKEFRGARKRAFLLKADQLPFDDLIPAAQIVDAAVAAKVDPVITPPIILPPV